MSLQQSIISRVIIANHHLSCHYNSTFNYLPYKITCHHLPCHYNSQSYVSLQQSIFSRVITLVNLSPSHYNSQSSSVSFPVSLQQSIISRVFIADHHLSCHYNSTFNYIPYKISCHHLPCHYNNKPSVSLQQSIFSRAITLVNLSPSHYNSQSSSVSLSCHYTSPLSTMSLYQAIISSFIRTGHHPLLHYKILQQSAFTHGIMILHHLPHNDTHVVTAVHVFPF